MKHRDPSLQVDLEPLSRTQASTRHVLGVACVPGTEPPLGACRHWGRQIREPSAAPQRERAVTVEYPSAWRTCVRGHPSRFSCCNKTPQPGWLVNSRGVSLAVWRLEVRLGCQHGRVGASPRSQASSRIFARYPSQADGPEALGVSFSKALIPPREASTLPT